MKPAGFDILYEEGPCLAVDKPGGLLTQAPPHIDSLEKRLRHYLQQRDAKPGRVYLGVPHRLDRPVSGVLLFARHVRAARRLSGQFERRMVDKRYMALLDGALDNDVGEWVDYIGKVPGQPRAEVLVADHPQARLARLRYRVLCRVAECTCVDIELDTGRYHQIRIQAGSRQHPIVGDAQYGARRTFGPACPDERDRCIALHARSISFYHPMTHESRTVVAPLPDYWDGLALP
jgi:23S rRNA pseudouridine1911/1915/1917 synthase